MPLKGEGECEDEVEGVPTPRPRSAGPRPPDCGTETDGGGRDIWDGGREGEDVVEGLRSVRVGWGVGLLKGWPGKEPGSV